jgi:glycosyltransferase involved in cell wall biosynthesis
MTASLSPSGNRHCPLTAVIVPCYNEQETLPSTIQRLKSVRDELVRSSAIHPDSFILFVDDGSADASWDIISMSAGPSGKNSGTICGLKLSRNFGHQNALLAGLMHVQGQCDCVVTIDADLQQDETSIPEFISLYSQGYDIVNGVRDDRKADGIFKRATAGLFYSTMRLLGVPLVRDQADFRLLSAQILTSLSDFHEVNLFLRGIIPTLGFKTAFVRHVVVQRKAGRSKYSVRRMISFALNGITSFSIVPIRLIALCGVLLFVFSSLMSAYVLLTYFHLKTVPGWASTVLPIYFIGGIQLLSIAVIGEYIGKSYMEIKRRPRYIIEKSIFPGK